MNDIRTLRWLVACVATACVAFVLARPSVADDDTVQTRSVSDFDRVRFEGAFSSEITAGTTTTRVTISAQRDVIHRITTRVSDGTLVVGMRSGAGFFSRSPTIAVELPVLREVENTGAGSVHVHGLTGADIEIVNSGSASIVAAGRAARETIRLNGMGKIDATGVDAREVTVENDGVGSVHVHASGRLTMTLNGVGEIRYTGEPTDVQSHVNGIGRIGRL